MSKLANSWAVSLLLKLSKIQLAEQRGERFLRLAAYARSRITELLPEEALKAARRGVLFIDVREREEFQRGYIRGARHIARGVLELKIEKIVPDVKQEIICYCGGGNRSALAVENLLRMGYTNVKTIAGGFQAWVDAGLPTVLSTVGAED